jgi:hypothetical protein
MMRRGGQQGRRSQMQRGQSGNRGQMQRNRNHKDDAQRQKQQKPKGNKKGKAKACPSCGK